MLLQSSMRSVSAARELLFSKLTAPRATTSRALLVERNQSLFVSGHAVGFVPRWSSSHRTGARSAHHDFGSPDPNIYRTIECVEDLEQAILDAWTRVKHNVLSDPLELRRRLDRRERDVLRRPPRAWCLAVRASDLRLREPLVVIEPETALHPA